MYSPPWFLFNHHFETIYPSLVRSVSLQPYERERITTPDRDFLDIDFLLQGARRIVVISHGLEGSSSRAYVKGMAKAFYENGFDVAAWNYRSCSEEMNKALRFYHSGATDDLATVVDYISQKYQDIFLVGFSLGGNLTLKYAGERELSSKVKALATFSVPLNLDSSCKQISKRSNWIYSYRFLRSLRKKVIAKATQFPELDIRGIEKIDNLRDFDNRYTGPLHYFKDAEDYYHRCSSIHFLETIKIPALIVNAKNDPFLSKDCFPENISNKLIYFEYPERGGHVGFASFNKNNLYWSEQRAVDFILHWTND